MIEMQLQVTARNPAPHGAQVAPVPGVGPQLRYAAWPSMYDGTAGTVCIFPGRSEFIEKYFETVADLRRRGFAVAVLDWRGQGGSQRATKDPRKNHVDHFKDYQADAMRFMVEAVMPRMPAPYTALGHSMGGNVLLHIGMRNDCPFDSLVLSAPMIALHKDRLPVSELAAYAWARSAVLAGFGHAYVPGGGPAGLDALDFENNPLTSDLERFRRHQEIARMAPQIVVGDPTMGWLSAALQAMRQLRTSRRQAQVKVPVLAFAAERDRIVSTRAIEEYCDLLKIAMCISLPQSRHEILQENDEIRSRFWAAFDAFLEHHPTPHDRLSAQAVG